MSHAMKGGIGSASLRMGEITVAALIVVNAVGDVRDPRSGQLIAGARAAHARSPSGRPVLRNTAWSFLAEACGVSPQKPRSDRLPGRGEATTIGVVATDAVLDKAGCTRLARVAHDGLARAIDPVHTAWDGDTLFALSTGHLKSKDPSQARALNAPTASGGHHAISPMALAVAAAWVTAVATTRAVQAARRVHGEGVPDLPTAAEL
jgi:L-aminopeptidase/D-esterase-like protein